MKGTNAEGGATLCGQGCPGLHLYEAGRHHTLAFEYCWAQPREARTISIDGRGSSMLGARTGA